METTQKTGMPLVEECFEDYGKRARELKREGRKIIGYVCSFVPLEMITAAGCVPFRVRGDLNEPITKGDNLLETIVCPFIRSCFDLAVKGRYDFLEGFVIPHACDSMTRSYSTWNYGLDLSYFHFINIPSVVRDASLEFFEAELKTLKGTLEKFLGKEITHDALAEAIDLHNSCREKVKALYEFRKPDPPRITGVELGKVLISVSSLPVDEANALLEQVLEEIGNRSEPPGEKGPRIFIDGPCIDNVELVRIVEGLGANVVADGICYGTRDFWPTTDTDKEPLEALARRYLDKVNCPKTYRENMAGTFEGDISNRFGDIGARAKDFKVDGAILYVYKYCDPFGFEVPARKAYYDSIDVPLLTLEDEYSSGTIGQLRTRIQAFLEMID
ncbi:MAG: 2-hydroxyacyl-CoA dehydratase [Deltaproteobacteria bacterium]|nr:2-hydroxyacyl-CoA dehydratase [Deltaproteobacteria bacterium]